MKPGLRRRPQSEHDRALQLANQRVIQKGRACEGKVSYANQNDARHAAKVAARNTDRFFDTYKCPWGDHYHITQLTYEEVDRDEGGWR
jgi:hypothetical protein